MILDYGLILDALIVVLLIATIVYAAILNRRMTRLRDSRAELQVAARGFAEAAARAEAGVRGLRQSAEGIGRELQSEIDKAKALRDELSLLVEMGEGMAKRLEGAATGAAARGRPAADQPAPQGKSPTPPSAAKDDDRTRRDLLKAIENLR